MENLWRRKLSDCPRRGTLMLVRIGLLHGGLRIRINGRESGLHRRKQPIEPYLTGKEGALEPIFDGLDDSDGLLIPWDMIGQSDVINRNVREDTVQRNGGDSLSIFL